MTTVEREYLNDLKTQNTELRNQVEQNQRDISFLKQHIDDKDKLIDLSNAHVDRAINIIMLFLAVAGAIATLVALFTKRRATKLLNGLENKYNELVKESDDLKCKLNDSSSIFTKHKKEMDSSIAQQKAEILSISSNIEKVSDSAKNKVANYVDNNLKFYHSKSFTADDWFIIGNNFFFKNNNNNAIKAYENAIELRPNFAEAWLNKGISLCNTKHYKKAIEAYDKAIEIRPAYTEAWNNKGNALSNIKLYDEAIKAYDKAIEIEPNNAKAWNNKGITLGNQGHYDKGIIAHDNAIEIKPEYATAWNSKANATRKLKPDKLKEALTLIDKAIELDHDINVFYGTKAEILYDMKKYKEALENINKSLDIDPKHQESIDFKKKIEATLAEQ